MTKEELEDLVRQVFASYNQQFFESDRKVVLRAWYEILHDLPLAGTKRAFLSLVTTSQFMPKPAEIRRAYIDTHTKVAQQPTPQIAWAILMGIIKDTNSGIPTEVAPPEALQITLAQMGSSVYGLHTNEDQRNFTKIYEKNLLDFQRQLYEIPETGAQAQAK